MNVLRGLLPCLLVAMALALAGCADNDVSVNQDTSVPDGGAGDGAADEAVEADEVDEADEADEGDEGDEADEPEKPQPEPSSSGDEASLRYQGTAGGSHQDTAQCGESATLDGRVQIGGGSVTLEVRDGGGEVVYTTTVDGAAQETIDTRLAGVAGTWTLAATRDGYYFSGQYGVELTC